MNHLTSAAFRGAFLLALAMPLLAGAQTHATPDTPPTPRELEARIRQTMLDLEYIGRYVGKTDNPAAVSNARPQTGSTTARIGDTTTLPAMTVAGSGDCNGCGGGTVQPNFLIPPRPGHRESLPAFERGLQALHTVRANDEAGRQTSLTLSAAMKSTTPSTTAPERVGKDAIAGRSR